MQDAGGRRFGEAGGEGRGATRLMTKHDIS